MGARIGLGYIGTDGSGIVTIPVMVRKLLGNSGKYFEVGAVATFVTGTSDFFNDFDSSVAGTLSFQYRQQPVDGGFTWKIGLTPLLGQNFFIPIYGGVSLGYTW